METEFEQWYQTLKKEIDDEVKDLAAMLDKLDIWIAKTKETKTIDDIEPAHEAILLAINFNGFFHRLLEKKFNNLFYGVLERKLSDDVQAILQMAEMSRNLLYHKLSELRK